MATKQQQVMTINKQKVEFCHFLTSLIGHKRAKEELLLAIRRLATLENPAGGSLYQLISYAQMLQYVNDLEKTREKNE